MGVWAAEPSPCPRYSQGHVVENACVGTERLVGVPATAFLPAFSRPSGPAGACPYACRPPPNLPPPFPRLDLAPARPFPVPKPPRPPDHDHRRWWMAAAHGPRSSNLVGQD